MANTHERRLRPRDCAHLASHRIGRDAGDVFAKEPFDLVWFLIRNETETELGNGASGNDSLSANALVAAGDSIDRQGRTNSRSFRQAVALLAPTEFGSRITKKLGVGGTDSGQI